MKRIFKYFATVCVVTGMASCTNFLNVVPDDIPTIDNAFTMRASAEKMLFTCYSYMPEHGLIGVNPAIAAGDEITHSTSFRSSANVHAWYIAHGTQSAANPRLDFWRGTNVGQTSKKGLFQGISDCNIFLGGIDLVPDMTREEKDRWRQEVEFLKAYYHFWLVRMYGPIPIKDKNVPVGADYEDVYVYRDRLDDCFDYIVGKLDDVIESGKLPEMIDDMAAQAGRISTGIVMAVKAEVLMTAASPLFNGNMDYAGLKDNRGVEIFDPRKTDEQRLARWEAAATACREAIDYLEAQGHGLYYYTLAEFGNISDETKTKLNIRVGMTEKWNKEVVWGNSNSRVGQLQVNAIPRGLDPATSANSSIVSNLAVPLKIAAQFYTENGVPITEDTSWDYEGRFDIQTVADDHKYYLKVGQKTAKFNFDREPRYYASLGFDTGVWFGQGKIDDNNSLWVDAKKGKIAGNMAATTWNDTGIWPKKLVNVRTTVGTTSGVTQIQYAWPVIRMNSLYLYYAEALNESGAPWVEVLPWVDMIRERAGLEGVEESWTNHSSRPDLFREKTGLREIIQRERLIETAFEGQRFWDLRRWKKAYEELNKPVTGWNTEFSTEEEYYVENILFQQNFITRDYFWPIANAEIYANKNTLQNYGW